jgi:hypothetical protein
MMKIHTTYAVALAATFPFVSSMASILRLATRER